MAYFDHAAQDFVMQGAATRRRRDTASPWIPLRTVLMVLALMGAAKIALFLDLGGAAYGARVAALQEGNGFERAAAHLLWIDPLSQSVIDSVRFGFR